MHRYASRTQAELEAKEYSGRETCTVTTYKLVDGRYENALGYDRQRANTAVARFANGIQQF